MASLASKATANGEIKAETPKLVEVKKAKSAPVTPKSKMYTMEPLYKNEALNPSAGNMYRVSSIYDGMMYNENNSQPAEPKVEKPNKNAKANKATSKNQEASVNSAESSIISKLDIVVGKVLSVKKHPDAESLYIEQIDIGESEPRTVVSGLVNFMQPDEIDGKLILVLKNLKPVSYFDFI
jgi:glutamyl-tRNA synthetase